MANRSLIIRKKLDIANEKYSPEAQNKVHLKKIQKNNFFIDILCYICNNCKCYRRNSKETAMKRTPKISDAEWEVMKVLWSASPATANDIVKILSGKTPWKRETIRTLINRLVQKKAVGFEKKGRQYHYFPLVTEAECIKAEARTFLKRLGGGLIEPMLVAFVEEENLSGEKIARLRRILKKAADENKKAEK